MASLFLAGGACLISCEASALKIVSNGRDHAGTLDVHLAYHNSEYCVYCP